MIACGKYFDHCESLDCMFCAGAYQCRVPDVHPCLPLAEQAFGNRPDAINLWIGDERSVSSMHKDHYENFYAVVKGKKSFILAPPSAIACLYETETPSGTWSYTTETGMHNVCGFIV